jgi:hypothetical protein
MPQLQPRIPFLQYAQEEGRRWRALFDDRMPHRPLPEWYAAERDRLFLRLEKPLAALLRNQEPEKLRAAARTLFSAVHGIVLLGLEEKLASTADGALETELDEFIATIERGLASSVKS